MPELVISKWEIWAGGLDPTVTFVAVYHNYLYS